MANVLLKGITKRFAGAGNGDGEQFTLGPLDLMIPDGSFTVLVGPSGCGKTTTLRLIAGLETATSGTIEIGDQPVDHMAPRQRDVAMVFQENALYPHMSVYANLAFPLKMRHRPKPEVDERVREVAGWLEVDALLERRPGQLSGGQQQRVALGRAIVRRPKVSLLDEPMAHLDTPLRADLRDLLADLQRRLGLTIVYVTHDQAEATTLGDQVAVLRKGHLEQVATPEALYKTPANRFVAEFFGSPQMNLIDGRLELRDGRWMLDGDGDLSLQLSPTVPKALESCHNRRVTLGIRPHNIMIAEASGEESNILTARVTSATATDGRTLLRFSLGERSLTAQLTAESHFPRGSTVDVFLPPNRLFLFEGESGKTVLTPK